MNKWLWIIGILAFILCVGALLLVPGLGWLRRESTSISGLVYSYRTDDSPVAPLVRRANTYLESKDYGQAEAVYRQVILQAPDDVVGYVGLGSALLLQGRYDEAKEQYLFALSLDPRSVQAMMGLGSVAHASGDYDGAKEYYGKILLYEPENADAYWGLAITFESSGDRAKAIENFQRTIDLAPGSSFAKLARERMQALEQE